MDADGFVLLFICCKILRIVCHAMTSATFLLVMYIEKCLEFVDMILIFIKNYYFI